MFAKGVLPIVLVLSLLAIVPSAGATSYVQFSLSDPEVTYINFGSAKEIFINNLNYVDAASTMSVEIRDDISHKLLDSTSLLTNGLDGYTESFLADLTFTSNSPNDWSAAGTVTFTDLNVDKFPPALAANFQSTRIWLSGNAARGYTFGIEGTLTPQAGGTMLVNRGSPWVFTGNVPGGLENADTNLYTVSAPGQPFYDHGTATFNIFLTADEVGDVTSLDELLANPAFYGTNGGSVTGTAMVPEPLTLAGVLMGLAALGGYLKKRRNR